jgi:hypothetical protein
MHKGGSMIEWPKTLEAVMKLDIDTVIPNRGNPWNESRSPAGTRSHRENRMQWQSIWSRRELRRICSGADQCSGCDADG